MNLSRLTTLILTAALAGCASSGTQVSQASAMQFKEGVTTENEIVRALGTPTGVTVSSGRKVLTYVGTQSQVKAATFIPIVGMFAGGAAYQATVAVYQFNAAGVLEKMTYSSSASGMRNGAQPAAMADTPSSAK